MSLDLLTAPMRQELTRLGMVQLRTPEDADRILGDAKGTVLLAVNSMCGCAGMLMRPAVAMALESGPRPDRMATVFAGQDREATERAREYLLPHPPSSPAVALLKDGEVVFMLPRTEIESRQPERIAEVLAEELRRHC